MTSYAKKTYGEKLLDPRWQKRRLEILEQDNFTCQFCKDKTKTLHIHHFCYNKNGNPWDVEDGDLMTLCEDCHYLYHLPKSKFTKLELDLIDIIQTHGQMSQCSAGEETIYIVKAMNDLILKNGKT